MAMAGGSGHAVWSALDRLRGVLDSQDAQQLLLRVLFLRCLADASSSSTSEGRRAWHDVTTWGMGRGETGRVFADALDHAWASFDSSHAWRPSESFPITPAAEPFLREVFLLVDGVANPRQLFEECLEGFSGSKSGGNYFTPRPLVRLMVKMLEPQPDEAVLDPVCGSGGFLAESARYVQMHQGRDAVVRLTGRDVHPVARQTAWMNLMIQGLEADLGAGPVDSLLSDDTPAACFDMVFANPPFSLKIIGDDLRGYDPRWRYGVPPRSNADFAWVQHVVSKLSDRGRGAILLPDGAAFVGGASKTIREGLVMDDVLAAIVALPSGLFSHTGVKASIWIFDRKKTAERRGQVLFVDSRELGGTAGSGRRTLSDDEIDRIANTYRSWHGDDYQSQSGWCRSVGLEEIRGREFNLQASRYVGFAPAADITDNPDQRVAELTGELYELFADAARLEAELRTLLGNS